MRNDLRGRRLLVVEEGLKDFIGHWYEYVRAVAEGGASAGVTTVVAAHRRASAEVRRDLDLAPIFDRTIWEVPAGLFDRALAKSGILGHNLLVFVRMRSFLRAAAPFDCVFVPTATIHHVIAWRLLLALYPRKIGRLVLLFRINAGSYEAGDPTPRFGRATLLLKWVLQSFRGHLADGSAVLCTDSERLAEEYRQLCGITPVVFPSPRIAQPGGAPVSDAHDGPPIFASLGPARFEKGIDLLQQAIVAYLEDPSAPPARFVIQWSTPVTDGSGAPYEPDARLVASDAVDFLCEPLDSAEYEGLLARTSCLVLPYRQASYFARISGVAVEAATAGVPMIFTQDTWIDEFVSKAGAGIAVPDSDAPALARAMVALARDLARFREEAALRQERAAAANSNEAFLQSLWGDEVVQGR